jgi:hypothetical protein
MCNALIINYIRILLDLANLKSLFFIICKEKYMGSFKVSALDC